MKRDVGYALIAALTLTTLAALWTLVQARDIADPDADRETRGLSGSVPVRPPSPDVVEAIQQATDVLAARDLFRAAAPADMATLNRLSPVRRYRHSSHNSLNRLPLRAPPRRPRRCSRSSPCAMRAFR